MKIDVCSTAKQPDSVTQVTMGRYARMATARICLVLLLAVAGCQPAARTEFAVPTAEIDVYFSPHGGCTEAIVREIEAAGQSIFIQAYSFTSKPIAKALLDAHRRNVRIEVLLDDSNETEKYSEADFLAQSGIPTYVDGEHAIAHNKIMILDGQTVITGSFNFTHQAETSNAENVLVLHSPEIAAKYMANWESHRVHSEPYRDRAERSETRPGRQSHNPATKSRQHAF